MRLLNAHNWTLKEFISDDEVPPYAILSHTWDENEVNVQQWESMATSHIIASDISSMKGYHKIKRFGQKLPAMGSTRWIGSKDDLYGLLSSITRIDEHILNGGDMDSVSVARRMSWASDRKTSRVEDAAYCLLGIFDVNIPLIYGEGRKAFQRLQEAIMNATHDQSLFAWGKIVGCPAELIDQKQQLGTKPIPWKEAHHRQPLLGLFAESPADFKDSAEIWPVDHGYAHYHDRRTPLALVNKGVLINLVTYKKFPSVAYWDDPAIAQPYDLELTVLLCRLGSKGSKLIGLSLYSWGDDYYSRTDELVLVDLFVSQVRFEVWTR
ncbi:uncharacterized protein FPRN_12042 [Fusarium proliferatum]|nr:hypothetical protein FPRO03_14134 [Fusarium proliferatum]CVL13864.1 uncharacterized protein FPRN_12042 [Fusarium proliferatum]